MDLVERTVNSVKSVPMSEAGETLDRLVRAASLVRSKLGEFLDPFGLTEVRYSVLVALNSAGEMGLSQSELAERLMQSESNVSTLIERMAQDDLVERSRSDADRRKRVLLLSPSGLRLVERVENAKGNWALRQLQGVPAHDRATLGLLLGQLVASHEGRSALKGGASVSSRGSVTSRNDRTSFDDVGSSDSRSWSEAAHEEENAEGVHSPHRALEQMLSALGLVNQLVKEESR